MFIYKQNVEQRVRKVFDWGHNWVTKIYLESEIRKYYPRCQRRKSILVKLMLLVKICETETAWIKSFSKERGCCYQSNSLIIEKMFTAQYKNYLIKMLLVLIYSKCIPKIFYSYTDVKPNKCIE